MLPELWKDDNLLLRISLKAGQKLIILSIVLSDWCRKLVSLRASHSAVGLFCGKEWTSVMINIYMYITVPLLKPHLILLRGSLEHWV